MKETYCSICLRQIEREDAPILCMSGSGIPRCLCDDCASDIEHATLGKEYEGIKEALDRISENLSKNNIDDPVTIDAVTDILDSSAERAKLIAAGEYDFSLDEEEESDFDEIPEDMLESEEDRQLDAEEEERANRLDKILNWVWLAVLVIAVGFMVWWLYFR